MPKLGFPPPPPHIHLSAPRIFNAQMCVCVCVCIFCIIMLEHLSIYTFFFDNIFHLDVHYVCMLVQRFEPQGRRFTNFDYYYYWLTD